MASKRRITAAGKESGKYLKQETIIIPLSFAEITIIKTNLGKDIHLLLSGGSREHIGSAVLTVPRPSLTGDGSMSCTSSVLNVTGHCDDVICRMLSEKACRRYGVTTVCTGGFHVDNLQKEQLQEIMQAVRAAEI